MGSQLNLDVNDMVHIVQKGETLYGIAKIYKTTYQKLAEYNNISAPYSLKIGQVLNLIQVYLGEIEFVDSDDKPISCVDCILYLEHDIKVVGTTDENALSQRVTTSIPIKIVEVGLLFEEMEELI